MEDVETTRLSSKGQVVIPEVIRSRLGLKPGAQFVVVGDRDVVIFKTISAPRVDQFEALSRTARRQARRAGVTRSDVTRVVKSARAPR